MDFRESRGEQHSRQRNRSSSSRERTGRRNSSGSFGTSGGFGAPPAPSTPWLVQLTDFSLFSSLWLVTGWFGGRTPAGHFILCLCAVTAALSWSLHQLQQSGRVWSPFQGGWIAGMAGVLLLAQLSTVPAGWVNALEPQWSSILPLWDSAAKVPGIPESGWQTLSLSPGGTMLGIPLTIAYGLLFFTALQRFQTIQDFQRAVRWIAFATATWAVFALLQLKFHNGKYYWIVESTSHFQDVFVTGPFTNRNHFAQLMVLGIGPLTWCVMTGFAATAASDQTTEWGNPSRGRSWTAWLWMAGLVATLIAIVFTSSRGGFAAFGVAICIAVVLMLRQLGSQHFWVAGLLALIVLGSGTLGIDRLLYRFEQVDGENVRLSIWEANWLVARDFPWLGTGIGTHINAHYLHLALPSARSEFTHAESSLLQVTSETGFIGLSLAVAAMLVSLYGPLVVTCRSSDKQQCLLAAAVLASLCGNFLHACCDFVWHVPGCMVSVLLLAAGGCRLLAWYREERLAIPASRPVTAWRWSLATAGISASGLLAVILSGTVAGSETSLRTWQRLTWQPPQDMNSMEPEELDDYFRERTQAAVSAARQRPYDSRMQISAARACLKMFDRGMLASENPLTLLDIRDAANTSEFESRTALRSWVQKIAGRQWKLLNAAQRFAERALQASPLEGDAYLVLADLAFLTDSSGKLETRYIDQALKLRPADPLVRYAAGQQALLAGRTEDALKHWGFCYVYAPADRDRLARLLVQLQPATELIESLDISWDSVQPLVIACRDSGLSDDCTKILTWRATAAEQAVKADPRAGHAWVTIFNDLTELGETERAIQVLTEAIHWHPSLRRQLGLALLNSGQGEAAIEHLKWVATRNPDDAIVQRALTRAMEYGLRPAESLATGQSLDKE